MLSNPLRRYAPTYGPSTSPTIMSNGLLRTNNSHDEETPTGSYTQSSQYVLNHFPHQIPPTQATQAPSAKVKRRQHPYDNKNTQGEQDKRASAHGTTIRRRISRACDQCNQLRTKCDGQTPCAHCVGRLTCPLLVACSVLTASEFGLSCEYIRERKKRGKASRKDLAQQAATRMNGNPQSPNYHSSDETSPIDSRLETTSSIGLSSHRPVPESQRLRVTSLSLGDSALSDNQRVVLPLPPPPRPCVRDGNFSTLEDDSQLCSPHVSKQPTDSSNLDRPEDQPRLHLSEFEGMPGYSRPDLHKQHIEADSTARPFSSPTIDITGYADISYPLRSPIYQPNTPGIFRLGSPLSSFPNNGSPGDAPEWLALPSSTPQLRQQIPSSSGPGLRYPVLQPLLPHLGSMLPQALACDLLDLYFSSSSSAYMHPLSP